MPLPLKARVAVRDLWEPDDSDVQKALRSVQDTVGWSVRCTPDFAVLWEGMQTVYEDAGEFVAAVVGLVRIWCQELNSLLNDDTADETWADKFLEVVGDAAPQIINLLVTLGKPGLASTTWDPLSSSFTLALPSTRVAFAPNHSAELRAGLVFVFEQKESAAAAAAPEGWADLGDPKVMSGAEPTVVVPVVTKSAAAFLPTLNDVPRPDILQLQPPYRLMVHDRGHCIEVHGSHSPSLELLAGYLEKWCQAITSRSNRPPMATVRLNKSAFGLGVVYDALTVAPYDNREPNLLSPVLILNLVENVLGYKLVNEYPESWRFVRQEALKKAA